MKKQFTFYLVALALIMSISSCDTGEKFTYAMVETEMGNMKLKLYNDTPRHRDNFIKLAKEGFYDDLLFHRIISGFMLQGGDPDSKGAAPDKRLGGGGLGYTIEHEIGRPHIKGALAAARTSNPEKRSSSCQFYIVQGRKQSDGQLDQFQSQKGITYSEEQRKLYKEIGGTPMLDMEYTVYGEVVEGMDVIDKICAVQTAPGDRPIEDVKMKVRIVE